MKRAINHAISSTLVASSVIFSSIAYAEETHLPMLTIYQGDIALIQEARALELSKAENHLLLPNIATLANRASLMLTLTPQDKNQPTPTIIAKKLDRNILSPQTLLNDFVGKKVTIISEIEGKEHQEEASILSNNGGLILQYQDRIELNLPKDARIAFDTLPEGLSNTPVLSVVLDHLPEVSSHYIAELTYLTAGLNWRADYIAKLDKTTHTLTLETWATINNSSGLDYQDAHIRLIAGAPHLIGNITPRYNVMMASAKMEMMDESSAIPAQATGDYYLYDIPAISNLKNNEETQLLLFTSSDVPYQKYYHFSNYVAPQQTLNSTQLESADVEIQFNNNPESHLGVPLPAGTIRLYEAGNNILFLGEDLLSATPKQQTVSLNSGKAFDVTLKRQANDYKVINEDEWESSYQLTIANAQSDGVEVIINELIPTNPDLNWEIIDTNYKATTTNSDGLTWKISLPAKSENSIEYTIRYTRFNKE